MLKTKAVFDFETKSTYQIKVSSKDAGNLSFAQDFTIKVTNVVESVNKILLSTDSIRENNAVGDSVGRLSSSPAESGGVYSLVAGSGDTGNSRFTISGDTLKANAVFDYESRTSYNIRVKVTNGANAFQTVLTIKITDEAEAPSSIPLTSPADKAESVAPNTKLVWEASSDADGKVVTYTVLLGTASTPTDTVSKNQAGREYIPTGQARGTQYYWQIVEIDSDGNKIVSSIQSYITNPCTSATMTFNGKTYKTVAIGTQCWMAENLNDDGHDAGASSCYNNQADSCVIYGRLYNSDAANNIANKVSGWHLPTEDEWNTLVDHLGSNPGTKLKEGGSSGFEALFGGFNAKGVGAFALAGFIGYFWTSTLTSAITQTYRYYSVESNSANIPNDNQLGIYHQSVRLLQDK